MKNHIHTSLLDTDLYKFTMQQSVLHKHMGAIVEYHFRCRTDGVDLVAKQKFIEDEIDNLCSLSFQKDEILENFVILKVIMLIFLKTLNLNVVMLK